MIRISLPVLLSFIKLRCFRNVTGRTNGLFVVNDILFRRHENRQTETQLFCKPQYKALCRTVAAVDSLLFTAVKS